MVGDQGKTSDRLTLSNSTSPIELKSKGSTLEIVHLLDHRKGLTYDSDTVDLSNHCGQVWTALAKSQKNLLSLAISPFLVMRTK